MRPLLAASIILAAPVAAAEDVAIHTEDSIFAVITHKGGFASGVAHNHLIAATGHQAELDFDPAAPLATRFELTLVDVGRLPSSILLRLIGCEAELALLEEAWSEEDDPVDGHIGGVSSGPQHDQDLRHQIGKESRLTRLRAFERHIGFMPRLHAAFRQQVIESDRGRGQRQ